MAEFTKLLVTDRGSALVMKALQGKGIIRFTRLAASSRQYQEEDIKELTSLEDIRQQGDISEMDAEGSSSIRLRVALPNMDLTEGYYIRTVGLYANDPDEGEILYGVSMETSAGGCYVPAYNHQIVSSLYFHISVAVGNAEIVSLEVDAGALVTRKQLDAVQQRITDEVKVLQEGMEEKADGTAFDNYKSATDTLLGNTDITGIGDGTVTGAIRELNTGIILSYDDGQYYAQHGDDESSKKVLGEISKSQLITVLANSGLGLTLESTPEEIYTALATKFPKAVYLVENGVVDTSKVSYTTPIFQIIDGKLAAYKAAVHASNIGTFSILPNITTGAHLIIETGNISGTGTSVSFEFLGLEVNVPNTKYEIDLTGKSTSGRVTLAGEGGSLYIKNMYITEGIQL